ncbi:putative ankyrin repeat-containing domain-containing protein [Helianthus annuus]|nr:putative ankyrin repeat-containing domain-containing protein [Helianthus annuus]
MNTASTSSGPPAIPYPLTHYDEQLIPPPLPEPPKPNLPRSDLLYAEKMKTAGTSSGPANPLNQQNDTIVQIISPPGPNLPRSDLLDGPREDYIKIGAPLYEAAIKGDWKAAKPILDKHPNVIRFAITENYDTLLHIAASAESTKAVEEFVTNLVTLMDKNDLELQNKNYNTALSLAAAAGNVKTATIMVKKNPAVTEIPGNNRVMPLYMAALFEKPLMVRYLYGISNKMGGDYWSTDNRGWVLQKCVEADIFDVAIKIVDDRPELITVWKGLLSDILITLAQKTDAFEGTKPNVVLRIINSFFVAFHVKIGPREKESEALKFLRKIWFEVTKMPKDDIDDILRGPRK